MLTWHQVTMWGLACHHPMSYDVTCHMRPHIWPGGGNHWNGILCEIRIWSRLTMAAIWLPGVWVSWSWCGQYDNTRHGHSITRRYQSEQRSHAQPSVRHHIPILIHASSRPIIRLYKMYSAFFKVVYWERVCYQMVQELSEELFRVLIKPMWVRNVLREKSSLINYFFLLALEGWNNFCVSGRKVEKWLQRERGN